MKIPLSITRYWLAMNASVVQSTAHAFKAWTATAALHVVSADTVPALTLNQVIALLLFFWGQSVLDYLDKNPLPTLENPVPK